MNRSLIGSQQEVGECERQSLSFISVQGQQVHKAGRGTGLFSARRCFFREGLNTRYVYVDHFDDVFDIKSDIKLHF